MKVYKTLSHLCEIQRLAYQQDDERCSRDALHFYLTVLKLVVEYHHLFPPAMLKKVSKKAMYGNPYHSIVSHMPELYRIISLRSIVAEGCERMFKSIRYDLQYKWQPDYNCGKYSRSKTKTTKVNF